MRKIRFRGKDAKTGEWAYGYYAEHHMPEYDNDLTDRITGYTHLPVIFNDEPGHRDSCYWREVVYDTIGQYTGMHDKNGKEIYEGDIVLVSDFTSVYASDYKGTVCFERGQWVVCYEKYGCKMTPRLFFDDFSDRKTTIIGNIHELKKEL